jgi:hypothetical protein
MKKILKKYHFNIILPDTSRFFKLSLNKRFFQPKCLCKFISQSMLHDCNLIRLNHNTKISHHYAIFPGSSFLLSLCYSKYLPRRFAFTDPQSTILVGVMCQNNNNYYSYILLLLLLLIFVWTANGVLPGGSGIAIRQNTKVYIIQNTRMTPRSKKAQYIKLHKQ